MASFKDNGRGEGPKRRQGEPRRRRQSILGLESLENRRLLTGGGGSTPIWHPTDTDLLDAHNGPLANLGTDAVKAYGEYLTYVAGGSKGAFTLSLSQPVHYVGTSIGMDLQGYGDFGTYQAALKSLGVIVTATNPTRDLVEGFVPLSKLPQVAEQAQTVGGQPNYLPTAYQQGASPNQTDVALNVATARTTFNINGAGQKIGVLSTSVNHYTQNTGAGGAAVAGTGLAASIASGDLPANVQVLDDSSTATDDEGRAMLEQIYDLAPGAALAYATGFNGEVSMGNNIQALFNAGATTLVDDIGYFLDPFYQDGVIQQSVNNVVAAGATYLSSAGNQGDSGYESQFRPVSATVGTLGPGTYMNFDPTGATQTTQLGINVYTPGTGIVLQFDQPFYTTNGVTSNVEIDILNQATGAIVQQANMNNVAVQQPVQITGGLPAGLYNVVIKVDSGPNPGHVTFYATGDGGFSVDTKFGSAGGTYYPSTHGHNAGASTISVGAVPFWATPNYTHTPSTDVNEPFSSTGPVLTVFNPDGTPLATPTLLLKPDVSATDANNTSFFIPGQILDTSQPLFPANPPYPGDPVTSFANPTTPTNQLAKLPNFTGTSSAAPNLAAIVALIKESNPALTRNNILLNLETTTSSLDNIPAGTWSPQAGYGLVDAVKALSAVQVLKVLSIVPGSGQVLSTVPSFVTVTFNQPVNIATVSAANLQIGSVNGASVVVGQPVGVDNPTFPSIVRFPISIVAAPGRTGNGIYQEAVVGSNITSENGQKLSAGFADRFDLEDTNGPRVVGTTFFGRVVTIAFSVPLNPSTVNPNNIFVFRDSKPLINEFTSPTSVIVSRLPGATFNYNPNNFSVTIDLTNVAQSSLPSGYYGLDVGSFVTDVLNNPLNGRFNNVFPSGTNPEAPGGSTFFQNLGFVTLQAPIITSLALAAGSDSGLPGDNNTNVTKPSVVGQITAKFPGSVSGLLVYAEFNGINHPGLAQGGLDLALGSAGRGFTGHFDYQTTTNALGQFVINYPAGIAGLPDGLNQVRVVVIGAPDIPPLPGLSSVQTTSFRVDTTNPVIAPPAGGGPASSIIPGQQINSLTTLTVNFADPVSPQGIGSPFAVPATLAVPALNPLSADNVGNYTLLLANPGGGFTNESGFITSATFVVTSARVLTSDPYTGAVNLTFAPGLPAGNYEFIIHSSAYGSGLSDAAGNPLVSNTDPAGTLNYVLTFVLQPTPTYITSYVAYTADPNTPGGLSTSGPRANYELPVSGVTPRAQAPPSLFTIDFSNSLNPAINYTPDVELIGSGLNSQGLPTGNFGDLGTGNSFGFNVVAGTTVTLTNSVPGATKGQYGYNNRLLISLPAGFSLPANYYRVYLPNNSTQAITDVFGNQLDGEFLGYQNATGKYVDQLQNGHVRGAGLSELPDLSGDGNSGGAFMTGFVVVPNGNIIYANAGAIYNPLIPNQTPDGSAAKPYPVLAPEAVPNAVNGGDLNSPVNAGANFDPTYDRSGDGLFEPSAFFAAQQALQNNGGPVVILAQSSIPTRDPVTGLIIQKPYVLQAPNPSGGQAATLANDASAAVPALTTLVFQDGTILKMQNAALLVQNQGSALQIDGGPNSYQSVIVTSYKDSTVGGATNGDPNSAPAPGDFGGIVFRNFSQAALPGQTSARNDLFPGQIPITGDSTNDNRLKGQFTNLNNPGSQADAVSGADDILSSISFLTERFAGGTVPQTIGTQYDGITLLNSRPAVVNSILSNSGSPGSAVAGLSVDVDSLRADDVAQGPLIRNIQFVNNALNGIYVRANIGFGVAEPTNAESYPINPTSLGGSNNYVFNDPYPYLLTSKMEIGQQLAVETGAQTSTTDRLYVIPGSLVKFESGAWLEVGQEDGFGGGLGFGGSDNNAGLGDGTAASLVVGDPTYAREYDQKNTVNPSSLGFRANSTGLAKVLFTSFNDNAATTVYVDPITQVSTPIVAPLPTLPAGALTPAPTKGDWGGIQLDPGSRDTINSAVFDYGGGSINSAVGANTLHAIEINRSDGVGAYVSITNNLFLNNADVPINTSPNAWLATDPATPLNSGAPFIHGNEFTGNDYNGVGVQGGTLTPNFAINSTLANYANLDVNSVWTGSDFSFFLRQTIVLGPSFVGTGIGLPQTPPATTLVATPAPNVTLTLQSTLPGTVLADGTVIAAPGVPLLVKLLTTGPQPPAEAVGTITPSTISTSYQQGAGFAVGIDNGIDPPADQLIDPGAFSEIRIVGIGANQTTGQARVPVIITSAYDNTVGTTVNGVQMNNLVTGSTQAPKPGDGGVIYFGGLSQTSYNLTDPRSGSTIDNADIRYITRVEQQGGGLVYGVNLVAGTAFTPSYENLFGLPLTSFGTNATNYSDQYNSPKSIAVSNSNFASFSSAGFYAHPDTASAIILAVNFMTTTPIARAGGTNGEPTHDYFYNDTFSNLPTGVYILSQTGTDVLPGGGGTYPAPAEAVFLNDDFYNDPVGIHTNGLGGGTSAHVATLAMDSIFQGSTISAVIFDGENNGGIQNQNQNHAQTIIPSQLVYDDFYGNAANLTGTGVRPGTISQAYTTNPGFRNAPTGNFFLLPTSSVIDVARSEIGPTIFGDMLYPQVSPVDPNNPTGPTVRNEPVVIGYAIDNTGHIVYGIFDPSVVAGDVNALGGLTDAPYAQDIVTLPGRVYSGTQKGGVSTVNYPDQWIPVLLSSKTGTQGNSGSPATYAYVPIIGQRDQVGDLRVPDPNSHNLGGFGAKPYFDLGAFEYIVQNPPVVDAVSATTPTGFVNIYAVNGVAGVNQLPSQISFLFNERLDQNTLNGMSVILEQSGGDGIFGNGNSPTDHAINLNGLLSFNNVSDILTINTSTIFTSLATASDEYRIILKGSGPSVIRDTSGLALDGLNLDANGNQTPLPSGADNFPGSDFQVTFTIDTHSPSIVPGTFRLDPASDKSGLSLNITNLPLPTFDGTITDTFPPINFLQGQMVFIDVSTLGNGIFDLLNAGTGVTDANGNFKITLTKPIPNTPNEVGTNGIQQGPGSTLTYVRVRIVNQAGNQSNLITDPFQAFVNAQALTALQEDTVNPKVVAFSPTANTVISPNANGQVVFTTTFSKNLKNPTVNANSVLVFRSGGSGIFTNPVAVPIIAGSFRVSYSTAPATLGFETISFAVSSTQPNDRYEVVLKGTGAAPITDLASNPLDGQGIGRGSDYTSGPIIFFSSSNARLIYVGPADTGTGTGVLGTRENPFPTIAAGMNAALIGDDVLVLPDITGPAVYREDVTMKPGVRLLSASLASTDTVFFAGSPYQTLIYGVPNATSIANSGVGGITTVYIAGGITGIPTEVSGFAIISPLLGDSNLGVIDSTDVAVRTVNTDAIIDRNIIVNAGIGIYLTTGGPNAPTSQVTDNLIAGNINGIGITDNGATPSIQTPFLINNNTIVDNTTGLFNISSHYGQTQGYVDNNIFYSNHDTTRLKSGTGINSAQVDTLDVGNNLFYQNGSTSAGSSQATGTFPAFNPTALSTKPDVLGNLIGNPYFAQAQDPRPNVDTPAVFFNYSNFDLTSRSVAINAASPAFAPGSDFLYRTPVFVAGHGFPGTGPASIGAFYFDGLAGASGGTGSIFTGTGTGKMNTSGVDTTGGTKSTSNDVGVFPGTTPTGTVSSLTVFPRSTVTGSTIGGGIALGTRAFTIVTTSLSDNGTVQAAGSSSSLTTEPGPSYIDVNFSDDINASTLTPTDLVLSGSGLNPAAPAHATNLAWIDNHAIRFFLTGGYSTSGTVNFSISQGSIKDSEGASLVGFSDTIRIGSTRTPAELPPTSVTSTGTTTAVTPTTLLNAVLPVVQPVAAAAPVAASALALHTSAVPTQAGHKLTSKELKQQAAEAKAHKAQVAAKAKAHKAEIAAQAKAHKAAEAKAHHAAKAAHKAKKAK